MKKVLQWGAFACALCIGQFGFADMGSQEEGNFYGSGLGGGNESGCCEEARPSCDQPTGECWCLYRHDEPCYYNAWRCVEDKKYCKKKCCRYVPQNYEVQHCRYVPKYETETRCRYVPETYYVDECIPCKRWVCDRKCKYTPRYYYKKTCNQNVAPAADQGCCPAPAAPACCR